MADLGESWTTQQLVEFLSLVSSFPDEESAIAGAVERAAEALEAEVGAVVSDGRLLASTGFSAGNVQAEMLLAAAAGRSSVIEVPGAGSCAVIAVPLEDGMSGQLVLARAGDAFDSQEANLLRGMGRVLTLGLRALRVLAAERTLREHSQEQALENARLLARLRERQRLHERLAGIQRAIVQRSELQDVLDAVVGGAAEFLELDAVGLRLLDPEDDEWTVLVASRGMDAERFPIGSRAHIRDGVGGRAVSRKGLVVAQHGDLDEEAVAGLVCRSLEWAIAAPIFENGRVVGALSVGSRNPSRAYSESEEHVLLAFAEHASLALTDAKNFGTALHRALHDMLTGLPNRALFLDRLEHAAGRAKRDGAMPAVLFLDLDGFKRVNDSLGHGAGDQLLIEVGRRLVGCLRPGDTAARFGGDEFAVLLEEIHHEGEATAVAQRIMSALHVPFRVQGREIPISVSLGSAAMKDAGQDLVRDADLAMYQAKARGKGQYEAFDPAMHTTLVERLRLESDLARAVDRHEFELAYQPIVELASGAVVAVEALVRWRHPTQGLLLPGAFIPAAEETGLIRAIGSQVLQQACMQVASWQDRHRSPSPLAVAVNLSVNQLTDPALVGEVADALDASGLDPRSLILEITETMLMEDLEREMLARLKELGVQIAVDDFGTGYSSLQYLHRFPIDILKIDRSFVGAVGEGNDAAVARAIIELGQSLDLRVIAEGVEHPAQVATLLRLGCRWGQGYHFSTPRTAAELDELIVGRVVTGWDLPARVLGRPDGHRPMRERGSAGAAVYSARS
ncbi:MAG TPA: EAL domain-containing protein [Solirubrobacteraceae bacterium]|nr:EAL domain-containing protein [Solirubrobacteraceae bacterium]